MSWGKARGILVDQGRGVMGAVIFGTPLLLTMETWWLGWMLPMMHVLAYALAGILVVTLIVSVVGFKRSEEKRRPRGVGLALDVAEVMAQSFVAGYVVLAMFGVVEPGDPLSVVARLGLFELAPLAFGASLANRLLKGAENGGSPELPFPKDVAVFAAGALFFAFPVAPTEEVELLAAHAGLWRLVLVVLVTLVLVHLVLYELEFQGQRGRLAGMSLTLRVGETFLVYVVAFAAAFLLLAGYGHFDDVRPAVWVQETIVLAFPAAIGGSAARVVL